MPLEAPAIPAAPAVDPREGFVPGAVTSDPDFELVLDGKMTMEQYRHGSPNATPTPAPGQAKAPGSGQEGGDGTKTNPDGTPKGQAPDIQADLEKLALGNSTETPEQKISRLERDNSASGKEARRLKTLNERLLKTLEAQGLEAVEGEDPESLDLVANDKYSKDAKDLKLVYSKMSDEDKALFESDPQKLIDKVLSVAKRALTKTVPTLLKKPVELSPERKAAAIEHLKSEMFPGSDKDKLHPSFEANLSVIEKKLAAPNTSKALREFANAEPELAYGLLSLQIDSFRTFLTRSHEERVSAAAQKKQEAGRVPDFGGGSSGGAAELGGGGDAKAQLGQMLRDA